MYIRLDRARRAVPVTLGAITLAGVGLLFAWDLFSVSCPAGAHDFLAAFPMAMVAVSYLVYHSAHRPAPTGIRQSDHACNRFSLLGG
jgi:hypothetical protein